jgi:hypothetical protein
MNGSTRDGCATKSPDHVKYFPLQVVDLLIFTCFNNEIKEKGKCNAGFDLHFTLTHHGLNAFALQGHS